MPSEFSWCFVGIKANFVRAASITCWQVFVTFVSNAYGRAHQAAAALSQHWARADPWCHHHAAS
jgi:hypothetical protein